MKTLSRIKTIRLNGAVTQIASLPLSEPDAFFSEWVAFNGNAEEYEIRFRLSARDAQTAGLDSAPSDKGQTQPTMKTETFTFPAWIKFETCKDAKAAASALRSLYFDRCSHIAFKNRKTVSFQCTDAASAKAIGGLFPNRECTGWDTTEEEKRSARVVEKQPPVGQIKTKLTIGNCDSFFSKHARLGHTFKYSTALHWNEVERLARADRWIIEESGLMGARIVSSISRED